MAAVRRKDPQPGEWRYSVGEPPLQLQVYERAERGNAIYTRIWDGKRYRKKNTFLCGPIRQPSGALNLDLEVAAQQAALDRYRRLSAGLDATAPPAGPLTLAEGFNRLLDPREGKWTRNAVRRKAVAYDAQIILSVLPRDLRWSEVKHAHYRRLWRAMAEQHRDGGDFGLRTAELAVGSLQTAAVWLAQEELIEAGAALPARGWRKVFHVEWADITGHAADSSPKPRYTKPEMLALWEALPKADPRLVLAFELGAELRLGQMPRSKRSDVLPFRGFRIGRVVVHGRGNKRGAVLVLTRTERHALTRALTSGYLADLEAAYRRGEIKDYYLIPGGKLRRVKDASGKPFRDRHGNVVRRARVENAGQPLNVSALKKMWRALELLAGEDEHGRPRVPHVRGRNWYGARRRLADDFEDVEKDARVLNRAGGWTSTDTREGYQEENRTEVDERVAEGRDKVRPRRSYRRRPEPPAVELDQLDIFGTEEDGTS